MKDTRPADRIIAHYNDVADQYDQRYDHRERGRLYYDHICQQIETELPGGTELLDIGCGTGLFAGRYFESGGFVTGIDISSGMIERASLNHPYAAFVIGNAEYLPFADESFEAVASLLAFSYLQNPVNMLKDVYRVLKPGGSVALCTLGKSLLTSGVPALYRLGEHLNLKRVGVGTFNEHYYTEEELSSLFSQAGFVHINTKKCSFAHLNLMNPIFSFARRVEPFIEQRIPQLAYNIVASGKKS